MKEISEKRVKLIILDPGHFHAALIQKYQISGVDKDVEIFAPDGTDVYGYISLIENYNKREKDPTQWRMHCYIGANYLQQLLKSKTGNLVILAGNNQKKAEYIQSSVEAGLDVLCDKPMVINKAGFQKLKKSLETAKKNGNIIYDVMTARYEWYNIIIQRLLQSDFLGKLKKGNAANPAIVLHSTHYFHKSVSGKILTRPTWYFDTTQQGTGIVDVTTHLTDLVQWLVWPQQLINPDDVYVLEARQWPTIISKNAYTEITGQPDIPPFLTSIVHDDSLSVNANGSFTYSLKNIISKVGVEWKFKAADGESDAFSAILNCARGAIRVVQDRDHNFNPALLIEPLDKNIHHFADKLENELRSTVKEFSGIQISVKGEACEVIVPEMYKLNHEDQFNRVVQQFLQYQSTGAMPDWEIGFMLSKYYTLQEALRISQSSNGKTLYQS